MYPLTSTSIAAAPAHWTGCGAHTNVYCCSLTIVSITAAGPWTKPSRQPVMAWLLENPSITIVWSLNRAGDRNGAS